MDLETLFAFIFCKHTTQIKPLSYLFENFISNSYTEFGKRVIAFWNFIFGTLFLYITCHMKNKIRQITKDRVFWIIQNASLCSYLIYLIFNADCFFLYRRQPNAVPMDLEHGMCERAEFQHHAVTVQYIASRSRWKLRRRPSCVIRSMTRRRPTLA